MSNVIKIIELCSTENGASVTEMAQQMGVTSNYVGGYIYRMTEEGKLFKAGDKRSFRYYAKKEHAEAADVKIKQENAERAKELHKKRNERRAAAERAKRAAARAAKGLPPYVPSDPKTNCGGFKAKKKVKVEPKSSGIVISTRKQDLENKRAHLKAVITWPEEVKVRKIPHGADNRFKFDPPQGWMGQFTREWYELRAA